MTGRHIQKVLISDLRHFSADDFNMEDASPWMLRVVLDKMKKNTKHLVTSDIGQRINDDFSGDMVCMFSSDNADQNVLQIRIKNVLYLKS